MVEAVWYGLFNKPFRDVTKTRLINSVNNKDCMVKLKFSIGQHQYEIIRGMKPAVFEIRENGMLVNQNPDSKDYQKYLENNILHMNEKTARQIIVLGSASYVPFMQLTLAHRREVIEDLLDISIFSTMNKALKVKTDENREAIRESEFLLSTLTTKKEMQANLIASTEKTLAGLQESREDEAKAIRTLIFEKAQEIEKNKKKINELETQISDYDTIVDNIGSYGKLTARLENEIAGYSTTNNFFTSHDNCPTCLQGITPEHKKTMEDDLTDRMSKAEKSLKKGQAVIEVLKKKKIAYDVVKGEIRILENQNSGLMATINSENERMKKLKKGFDSNGHDADLKKYKQQLESLEQQHTEARDKHGDLIVDKEYLTEAAVLLKDTGIKTAIIKEYLPLINVTLNNHLEQLGLNVNFILDETFSETIKSRGRDDFTYYNFSEGEKARINLALMFTWREIAKKKNSTSTNLLIMDETFDSSLDADATDTLLNMITGITAQGNTNVFVISHKAGEALYDKFRSVIEFKKVNDFTQMVAA